MSLASCPLLYPAVTRDGTRRRGVAHALARSNEGLRLSDQNLDAVLAHELLAQVGG